MDDSDEYVSGMVLEMMLAVIMMMMCDVDGASDVADVDDTYYIFQILLYFLWKKESLIWVWFKSIEYVWW